MLIFHTIITFLRDKDYRELIYVTLGLISVGTIFYHKVEEWSVIDSIYFCIVLLTTTGLGDMAPVTKTGRIFTIFYIIFGVVLILTFINCVHNHYNNVLIDKKKNKAKNPFSV